MINLPDGVDKYSPQQKIVAGFLVLSTLIIFYYVLPPLVVIMANLWLAALLIAPIVFAVTNWHLVWGVYTSITWSLTKSIIGLDVLSALDRYVDWLDLQVREISKDSVDMKSRLVGVENTINQTDLSYKENLKDADLLDKKGLDAQRTLALERAAMDKEVIANLLPAKEELKASLQYVEEVAEVLKFKREQFAYTLKSKRLEFETKKITAGGLSIANRVLGKDSAANKIKEESLRQLSEQINKFTANIESYKTTIKPALEKHAFDKEMRASKGLELLEEFRKSELKLN